MLKIGCILIGLTLMISFARLYFGHREWKDGANIQFSNVLVSDSTYFESSKTGWGRRRIRFFINNDDIYAYVSLFPEVEEGDVVSLHGSLSLDRDKSGYFNYIYQVEGATVDVVWHEKNGLKEYRKRLLVIIRKALPYREAGLLSGIGIGAHVTSISLKTHLPSDSPELLKNTTFKQALNFFHYPFSHKLPYTSVLLITYILNLLDLYKGKILQLNTIAITIVAAAGISIGLFTTVLIILAKTQKLMLSTVLIILTSIHIAAISQLRNIMQHPISLLFTSMYWTILLTLIAQKQSKIDIRTPAKKFIKKWFEWDIDVI